jgi:predicted transcriptional regulator
LINWQQLLDRDRQYHLKRALVRYVEVESWHLQAISEVADADAGKLTDLDAVKAKWKNVPNVVD